MDDEKIQELADEAEQGYDPSQLRSRKDQTLEVSHTFRFRIDVPAEASDHEIMQRYLTQLAWWVANPSNQVDPAELEIRPCE